MQCALPRPLGQGFFVVLISVADRIPGGRCPGPDYTPDYTKEKPSAISDPLDSNHRGDGRGAAGLRLRADGRANHRFPANTGSGDGHTRPGQPNGDAGRASRHAAARHVCASCYGSANSGPRANAAAFDIHSSAHVYAGAGYGSVVRRQ